MVIDPPLSRSGAQVGALTVTFCATCEDRVPPHSDEILGARSKVRTQLRWVTAVGLPTVRLAWWPVTQEFSRVYEAVIGAAPDTPVRTTTVASAVTVASTDMRVRIFDLGMRFLLQLSLGLWTDSQPTALSLRYLPAIPFSL